MAKLWVVAACLVGARAAIDPKHAADASAEFAIERAAYYPPSLGDLPVQVVAFSEEERRAALAAGPLDWRSRGAVTPPTSQGRCATCAYFAGVATVEGAWNISGRPLVKLSEQEEIDCYNNGGYAMPNMERGIARAIDAPLANHSDPNITGCRGITNCTSAKARSWAKIDGIRGSKTHMDPDILALLQAGPAAVSIDAGAYSPYHGGIINCSGLRGVDHANALVGYGIQPPPAKCASQPANSSYETYCDTAFLLGSGGREWWGTPKKMPASLDECCALCAETIGSPPEAPAWNTPRCGAANWQDGVCTMMATDPTGHQLPGMANYAQNVTSCVPFKRAPIATKDVGYFIVKNSWGPGFGEGGYARFLFGTNCMRGVVQPYICPGPACPPPPPKPAIATLADCVAKAATCREANFVSFSLKTKVCSWHKSCSWADLEKYVGNNTDYQSSVIHSVGGSPAAGTIGAGCCGDLYSCSYRPFASGPGDCNAGAGGAWDIYARNATMNGMGRL